MITFAALATRRPVLTNFAMTFALSWGGILLVIGGPGWIPDSPERADRLFPFVYLAMLVGPSVAGILLTGLVHGRAGLRRFLSRLLTWRVGVRWYAIALLTAPVVVLATLLTLSLVSPAYLPGIFVADDKLSILLFGFAVGLGAGCFEELGWTGFATPELRTRRTMLTTGLVVGLFWGAWHLLAIAWGGARAFGDVPMPLFVAVDTLTFLPAYRVLMVWVYDRTGSLLVGMLMHASLTTSVLALGAGGISGVQLLIYDVTLAAAFWVVAATVVTASGGHFSRQAFAPRVV